MERSAGVARRERRQHSASGEIEGDWKSERVRFRPARRSAALGRLGAGARERWTRGRAARLARGAAMAGATDFDWQPGMPRAFREMDVGGLLARGRAPARGALIAITRWWRLLALAGCPTSWCNALRARRSSGLFFNIVMPGATGGDVIKGVVVAKREPRARRRRRW